MRKRLTTRKKKTKKKTVAFLKKKLQAIVNKAIRERDCVDGYFTCISCGKTLSSDKCQAGHYVPVSKSQLLRFDYDNIHGECSGCNCFNEYHLIPYRSNLIQKIGLPRVERLEYLAQTQTHKYTRDELEELINEGNPINHK